MLENFKMMILISLHIKSKFQHYYAKKKYILTMCNKNTQKIYKIRHFHTPKSTTVDHMTLIQISTYKLILGSHMF